VTVKQQTRRRLGWAALAAGVLLLSGCSADSAAVDPETGEMAGSGIFVSIMRPLYIAISWILRQAYLLWSHVTGVNSGLTWVLSIVSLTVLVRVLLIPLFVRQINSTRRMQMIQPKMKALQDKYGADREKLGIETQKLMKEEGVNPASSCLPLLLQMPIFFALYQVLWNAAKGNMTGSRVMTLELVQSLNQVTVFGAKLSGTLGDFRNEGNSWGATQWVSLVLVLVMTALFFITQKQLMSKNMTPEAMTGPMAQQQKMMLYLFPAMYLFMGIVIQVGVLIYWVTSNLWTLGQQYLLIRNNPTPGTPAYIDWEERMIRKGKDPVKLAEERAARISRRPQEAKTTTSASGVKRQTAKPPTANAGPADTTDGVQRQKIDRAQPKKQTRAQRKGPTKK
jgi:YidC/Oxa1 family membrane protein insertase